MLQTEGGERRKGIYPTMEIKLLWRGVPEKCTKKTKCTVHKKKEGKAHTVPPANLGTYFGEDIW